MTTDFLIIGGGIIGLSLSRALRRAYPDAGITVIEKEPVFGRHGSGRNSGVLHAGFYYTADSLKARFTREGNRRLQEYCEARGLGIRQCGKLVVAKDEDDLPGLDELLRRAAANGVELHEITAREAREIEPRVWTLDRALFSPTTATVDPKEVVAALVADAAGEGIAMHADTAYLGRTETGVRTTKGTISAGYTINAAGLYADRVARDFGFGEGYRILPLKGLYLYGDEGEPLRTHIYPVPDLGNPFLGVHLTLTVHGRVKIGPTAVPAFWREQYRGFSRFSLRELAGIVPRQVALLARNDFGFRALAARELRKYSRRRLVREASGLVPDLEPARFRTWGPAGIRAQLYDLRSRRLEMDFRMEGDDRSFHILNAVSPAFTCAMPFADYAVEEIRRRIG